MPETKVQRIAEVLNPWVEEVLTQHALGDRVLWETTLVVTDNGPAIALVIFLPGLVLGESIQGTALLTNPFALTKETVGEIVQRVIEALRAQRSAEAQAPLTTPNGHRG